MATWQYFALGSAFFAGLTALLGKIGVVGMNANLATFIRTIVILAMTALVLTLRSEWKFPDTEITHKSLWALLLSGVATGASWLCYYRALQLGPASKVAPVDKLSVVFAILLAVVFLGERLSLTAIAGAVLIVGGSMLMLFGA